MWSWNYSEPLERKSHINSSNKQNKSNLSPPDQHLSHLKEDKTHSTPLNSGNFTGSISSEMILLHLANSFAAIPNASGNSSGIRIPQLKAGLYSTTLLNYEMFVLQLLFNNPLCKKSPSNSARPSCRDGSLQWV